MAAEVSLQQSPKIREQRIAWQLGDGVRKCTVASLSTRIELGPTPAASCRRNQSLIYMNKQEVSLLLGQTPRS